MTFPLHPACAALPELSPERYRELVESIRAHGLVVPIVRHEGVILDGRHRLRACAEVCVAPRFTEWDGLGGTPAGFIRLMQIRRDMTEDQRAAWAALYVLPAEKDRARAEQAHGKTAPGRTLERNGAQANGRRPQARDRAAETAGVGRDRIDAAAKLREHHEPLLREVEAGTLSLPEAGRRAAIVDQVAQLPEDERERAAAVTAHMAREGVPSSLAPPMVGRLRAMPPEDRLRIYALSESEDEQERTLALTELAGTPPMPHPALELLAQAGDRLSRALRYLDGEAAAGDVRRAREIVRDVSRSLQEPGQ